MTKKIVLAVTVAVLLASQCLLLYALQHGASQEFERAWQTFGTARTTYSATVFQNVQWWWSVPIISCLATSYALWRGSRWAAVLGLVLGLLGVTGLLWAIYAPALMIQV